MTDRLLFFVNRLRERLWIKPLLMCVLSVGAVFLARIADNYSAQVAVFDISVKTLEMLLQILSASMLVIATFAVASMVSAYASASTTATPRAFPLIVSDDVSQNALSLFVGSFIFSVVGIIATSSGAFGQAGRFVLFLITLFVFALVVVTFVTWVDRIARLGRLGTTIEKVESAAMAALVERRLAPALGGIPVQGDANSGQAVYGTSIGFIQRVDMRALQDLADKSAIRIRVAALPGMFVAPGRPLAWLPAATTGVDVDAVREAFIVGRRRTFDGDPRFGLIALSEIACRALSPAVNDPGTAIDVIGSLVRLFAAWSKPLSEDELQQATPEYPLVEVAGLAPDDLFDDAFRGIARDGAGTVEVAVRLQKAFQALTHTGSAGIGATALAHAREAFERAERALDCPGDIEELRQAAWFVGEARVTNASSRSG